MTAALDESVTSVVDASGNCTIRIAPGRANIIYQITQLTSSTDRTDKKNTMLRVYKNSVDPGNMIDSTWTADNAISPTAITLYVGEKIIASYEQGMPGSHATFHITGTIRVV